MTLGKRLARLEGQHAPAYGPVIQLTIPIGETEEAVLAAYEAEHGPIPEYALLVIRTII